MYFSPTGYDFLFPNVVYPNKCRKRKRWFAVDRYVFLSNIDERKAAQAMNIYAEHDYRVESSGCTPRHVNGEQVL